MTAEPGLGPKDIQFLLESYRIACQHRGLDNEWDTLEFDSEGVHIVETAGDIEIVEVEGIKPASSTVSPLTHELRAVKV